MSLDFDFSRCADRGACVDDEGRLNDVMVAMIWATMFVGIREITAANAVKFAARLRAYENAASTRITSGRRIDEHVVRRYAGLKTNVSEKTDAKFASWLGKIIIDRSRKEIENEAIQIPSGDGHGHTGVGGHA